MIRPRRWRFPALAAAAVLTAAAAQLPLRLVLPDGMAATDATGSVWAGHITGGQWRGAALGDMDAGLRFWPLLAGRADMAVAGPGLTGTLHLAGREVGVESLSGRIRLATTLPIGAIELDGVTAVFDSGQCLRAAGRVQALASTPGGGMMQGDVRCDGGLLRMELQSAAVTLDLRLSGDGRYSGSAVLGAGPAMQLEGRI